MKKVKALRKIGITSLAIFLVMSFTSLSLTTVYASDIPDPEVKGSITVHKFSSITESKMPGTGLELDSGIKESLGHPLENVGVRLCKVKSSFAVTHNTTPTEARLNSDVMSEKFTSQDGSVEWANLEHGYYVIVETITPTGYQKSSDSIVSLPMGITESGSGWNYDIHVYPKSIRSDSLFKDVIDRQMAYSQGESAFWQIQGMIISDLKNGDTYGSFSVYDPLDNRLTYKSDSETVYATSGINGNIKLVKDDDYFVEVDSNNKVTWTLTNLGIDRVVEEKSSGISIEFETIINEHALAASLNQNPKVSNGAGISGMDAHGASKESALSDTEVPSINLSGIRILKVDSINVSSYLNGAEFKIAETLTDAQNGKFMKIEGTEDDVVLVTGDNATTEEIEIGTGMFTGLVSSDSAETSYFLVETKAPDGYVMRKSPIEVTIEKDKKIGLAIVENQKIGNPPIDEEIPTFPLPKTGGFGTLILIMLGWIMIYAAVALGTYLKTSLEFENNAASRTEGD